MVCGFQNIFQKNLYKLFLKIGVISKYLYQPDFLCVKNMLKILKNDKKIKLIFARKVKVNFVRKKIFFNKIATKFKIDKANSPYSISITG